MFGVAPPNTAFATGVAAWWCGGTGGNPGFSNHNSGAPAMHLVVALCDNRFSRKGAPAPHLRHLDSALQGASGDRRGAAPFA